MEGHQYQLVGGETNPTSFILKIKPFYNPQYECTLRVYFYVHMPPLLWMQFYVKLRFNSLLSYFKRHTVMLASHVYHCNLCQKCLRVVTHLWHPRRQQTLNTSSRRKVTESAAGQLQGETCWSVTGSLFSTPGTVADWTLEFDLPVTN